MKCVIRIAVVSTTMLMVLTSMLPPTVSAQDKKPNILVIMGDDVGWFNIGAYHRGMMRQIQEAIKKHEAE